MKEAREIEIYNKIKRKVTESYISDFLRWKYRDSGIVSSYSEAVQRTYETETKEYLTQGEMDFVAEYIESYFDVNSTIKGLFEEAMAIVRKVRRNNFSGIDTARSMSKVSKFIFPDKYVEEED